VNRAIDIKYTIDEGFHMIIGRSASWITHGRYSGPVSNWLKLIDKSR
jgi:hypothetical protein